MYKVTCEDTRTPSRGWYSIFSFTLSQKEDYDELKWSIRPDEDVALMRVNLREFRDGDISDEGLKNLDGIIEFFRHHNRELIVRFVYDIDGNGLTNEPKSKDIIKRHMEQIAPSMVKNADIIITMQGIFTGSWGEMHSSRYSDSEDVAELCLKLYEETGGAVNIALRTPEQIRRLQTSLEMIRYPLREQLMRKISLYDDGILASETDMGTFAAGNLEKDFELLERIAGYNYIGGECVNDNELNDADNAVSGLSKRHVTYLNSQYDTNVIDKWKEDTVGKTGVTVFDYLTQHLGYCLEFDAVKARPFGKYADIVIKNTGFAPFYGQLMLTVNDKLQAQSVDDVILPGEKLYLSFEKGQLEKNLKLSARRVRDGKKVRIYV